MVNKIWSLIIFVHQVYLHIFKRISMSMMTPKFGVFFSRLLTMLHSFSFAQFCIRISMNMKTPHCHLHAVQMLVNDLANSDVCVTTFGNNIFDLCKTNIDFQVSSFNLSSNTT